MCTGPSVVFDLSPGSSTSTVLALDSHSVLVTPNSSFSLTCTFKCYETDTWNCEPFKWSRSLLTKPSTYVPLPAVAKELAIERNKSYDASALLHRRLEFTSVQFNTSSIYHCMTPTMVTLFILRVAEGNRLSGRAPRALRRFFIFCTAV